MRVVGIDPGKRIEFALGDQDDIERMWDVAHFLQRVQITDDCWFWQSTLDRDGYGRYQEGTRRTRAHRKAYELFVGAIPDGYVIDHLCRQRDCVNPDHLEAVTSTENRVRANAYVTHCKQGHSFSEENTYIYPNGIRRCRICIRDGAKRRYHRNPEKFRARQRHQSKSKRSCGS